MKPLWKNRSFTSVWIGNGASELAGAFGTFCNSILVYQLTGSTLALGSMWILYYVPSLILQLVIGPYIDRWSRKWIMILTQWTRAGIFLLPLFALFFGQLEVWHIYTVQVVIGLITPLYIPANQAITPTIVKKDQLQTANGYLEGTMRLMMFVAPLTAGLVIEYIGVEWTLMMISSLLSVSGLLLLQVKERRGPRQIRKPWVKEFLEGTTYFFTQKIIVWLGVFLAFVQFGVGVTMVVTLPYITEVLSGSELHYGLFMAGFPAGYVIGSLLVGKIKISSRRILMLGSLFIGGLTFVALGFNHSIGLAIITEMIGGVMIAFFSIHNITILQKVVPDHLMGKVVSVRMLIVRGAIPLGVLAGGILSEIYGIRPLYFLIGSVICLTSLIGILVPYFKFIDNQPTEEKLAS
ncbi:MFS transporter [Filobacillus milosensis]|uniref:MFS transporter n=1 Tax=Filobacillus milosensis TaxID=94137 RepID=A0A4Y8IN08_9BACI|nr:MFS transporter [Filobacillus milosensis]TFB21379.1 MFS transporter [Filobacillus milosensis]